MLTERQQAEYYKAAAGFAGERKFFQMIESLQECIVLWDVALDWQYKGSAQFDFLVIHGSRLIHYDVKNVKGHYVLTGDNLKSSFGHLMKNPLGQLLRADGILKAHADSYSSHYEVESYVVFINEDFHFSGNNDNEHWLFPGQLKRHLRELERANHLKHDNIGLGNYLLSCHNPHDHILPVKSEFSAVARGMKCPQCCKLVEVTFKGRRKFRCPLCSRTTLYHALLEYNLTELYYLKGSPFHLKEAMAWCGNPSRASVYRVLKSKFKSTGHTKGTKYYL
ncbi:nuclease-related domain-containing protein [Macrococcus equipercicus]|uniref:NERD domain-containing protein n=1 Tax=Macrococcus equipercicus TaxID=69967 RepID=A0A9Q9BV16_9STAP|nr:nuclease-related domain-containing protein [Macrococcus equipercicus]UTH13478.1 NERD domain-containing protein [Macrococcus equipercicus]